MSVLFSHVVYIRVLYIDWSVCCDSRGSEEIMNNLAAGQFEFVKKPTPDPRDKKIKDLMAELKKLKSKL
jgi:hypothetical protein